MTKYEMAALFTALERLCENKDLEGIAKVVDVVLREVRTEEKKDNPPREG